MPSEAYWLQLEAQARVMAWHNNCSAEWAKLADLYRENAENEHKRADQQEKQNAG
jgi:hypothetical protein